MPGTSSVFGLPYPLGTELPFGSNQIHDLVTALEAAGVLYKPYVDLRASAVTSIPHNAATYTKVALATQTHLDADAYSVTSSVVTVLAAGTYSIGAGSGFATGTALSEFAICLNGLAFSNKIRRFKPGIATASAEREGSLYIGRYTLAANDTIQIGAYQFQSSGSAALNTSSDSRLVIERIS